MLLGVLIDSPLPVAAGVGLLVTAAGVLSATNCIYKLGLLRDQEAAGKALQDACPALAQSIHAVLQSVQTRQPRSDVVLALQQCITQLEVLLPKIQPLAAV